MALTPKTQPDVLFSTAAKAVDEEQSLDAAAQRLTDPLEAFLLTRMAVAEISCHHGDLLQPWSLTSTTTAAPCQGSSEDFGEGEQCFISPTAQAGGSLQSFSSNTYGTGHEPAQVSDPIFRAPITSWGASDDSLPADWDIATAVARFSAAGPVLAAAATTSTTTNHQQDNSTGESDNSNSTPGVSSLLSQLSSLIQQHQDDAYDAMCSWQPTTFDQQQPPSSTSTTTTVTSNNNPNKKSNLPITCAALTPGCLEAAGDRISGRQIPPLAAPPEYFNFLQSLPSDVFSQLARMVARFRRGGGRAAPSVIVSVNLCACITPHQSSISNNKKDDTINHHHLKESSGPETLLSLMLVELHPELPVVEFLDRRLPAVVRQHVGNRLERNFVVVYQGISMGRNQLDGLNKCWTVADLPSCIGDDLYHLEQHPLYRHLLADLAQRPTRPKIANLTLCPIQYKPNRPLPISAAHSRAF